MTLNLLHRDFVSFFNVSHAFLPFHFFIPFTRVYTLLVDPTVLGYSHLLASLVVGFILLGCTFRAGDLSLLHGPSLVA